MKKVTLLDKPVYQSVNMLTDNKYEPISAEKGALHVNLMGWGISLGDLVEWRIGANKKNKNIKVSRLVDRLGDYSTEFRDDKSRFKTVNKSASNASLETRPIL